MIRFAPTVYFEIQLKGFQCGRITAVGAEYCVRQRMLYRAVFKPKSLFNFRQYIGQWPILSIL